MVDSGPAALPLPGPGTGHNASIEWRHAGRPGRSRSPPAHGTVPIVPT